MGQTDGRTDGEYPTVTYTLHRMQAASIAVKLLTVICFAPVHNSLLFIAGVRADMPHLAYFCIFIIVSSVSISK